MEILIPLVGIKPKTEEWSLQLFHFGLMHTRPEEDHGATLVMGRAGKSRVRASPSLKKSSPIESES